MDQDVINMKYSDDMLKFIQSPLWLIIKYRYNEYKKNQQQYVGSNVRQQNWSTVARLQGMLDCIDELINITERINKEILDNQLDVDAALNVIENKRERGE